MTLKVLAQRITALEKLVHDLRDAPRQQDQTGIRPESYTTKESYPGIGQTSAIPHIDPTPRTTNKSKHPSYKTIEWWKPRLEILALFFGMGYAVVTYFQWRDLRRNFEADQRAWLGETGTKFDLRIGAIPQISTTFTNTGKTPAFHVRTQVVSHAFRSDESFSTTYLPGIVGSDSVVFPGAQITTSPIPLAVVTPDTLNMLTSGQRKVMFYGCVLYDDAFGRPHHSHFCNVLDRDIVNYTSGTVSVIGLSNHRLCDTYNDAN